jgi:transposase
MGKANKTVNLSEFEKGQISAFKAAGMNSKEISRRVGRAASTVRCYLTRLQYSSSLVNKPMIGRPRKTTSRQDRHCALLVKANPFATACEIRQDLGDAISVSDRTIRRRIQETTGCKSYWAAKKPLLTKKHKKDRLEWAKEHADWTPAQWHQVLWSDESPYCLIFRGSRRVWRLHNSRYDLHYCIPTIKHDVKINVWGSFSAGGVGILHKIEGIMNQNVYMDIIEDCMIPSADKLFGRENWLFQQDNDPKHTAHSVQHLLAELEVPRLPWRSQSPDLNPIENLWSILDLRTRHRRPKSADELFKLLQTEWRKLPVDLLETLVDSMPHRCRAVIEAKGGPTKYWKISTQISFCNQIILSMNFLVHV